MAAPQGTVRFHRDGQDIVFRVDGRATMYQSLPFRRFADQCLAGPVHNVYLDLRHCTYIDSTFLGTFLYLKRAIDRRGRGELLLVSPSAPCVTVLEQMGVKEFFSFQNRDETAAACWIELAKEIEDQRGFQHNVLQAHEELANLPGAAGEPFRAVVRCLAKELDEQARD